MDGPLSLFQGGGRYGLSLALALPGHRRLRRLVDRGRRALGRRPPPAALPAGRREPSRAARRPSARRARWPDELATFVAAFERAESGWRIEREPAVLDLPGAGLCVPDLASCARATARASSSSCSASGAARRSFAGSIWCAPACPNKILFAASKSLRVGEALLDDAQGAALYVFSRVLGVRAVLEHLERLAGLAALALSLAVEVARLTAAVARGVDLARRDRVVARVRAAGPEHARRDAVIDDVAAVAVVDAAARGELTVVLHPVAGVAVLRRRS